MPALDLFVSAPARLLPTDGILVVDPPLPGLPRVLIRQLVCTLRAPPAAGAFEAVLDTGAPLSIFPHHLWSGHFSWRAGRDYEEIAVAGGYSLTGRVLHHRYSLRLARLRVPVVLAGTNLQGDRLTIDSLVCQLADPGGPPFIILGLWGGPLTNRRLAIDEEPGGDDLLARLDW